MKSDPDETHKQYNLTPNVDRLLTVVTRIKFPSGEGHATGFFYNDEDNETYLITNRHVVFDVGPYGELHDPDKITISIRHNFPLNKKSNIDVCVNNPEENYQVDPNFPLADVVAIPLDLQLSRVDDEEYITGSTALHKGFIFDDKIRDHFIIGDSALVLGYPGGYVEPMGDFPVGRSAMLSTHFGAPHSGRPIFLTDATMHKGMSGSPIFSHPRSIPRNRQGTTSTEYGMVFLGVHSATEIQPGTINSRPYLNLNTSWYATLVEGAVKNR